MPVNCRRLEARLLVVVVVVGFDLETRRNPSLDSFDRPRAACSLAVVLDTGAGAFAVVVEKRSRRYAARAGRIHMRHRD